MSHVFFWAMLGLATGGIFVMVDTACYVQASTKERSAVKLLPGGGVIALWRTRRDRGKD